MHGLPDALNFLLCCGNDLRLYLLNRLYGTLFRAVHGQVVHAAGCEVNTFGLE